MSLKLVLALLSALSLALTLWQWTVARRFALHQRVAGAAFHPPVTLLKPLKGCDTATEACLRSWFTQEYAGPVQILFAVASAEDPVCALVRRLMGEFADVEAQLVVCGRPLGTNAKVSKLAQVERLAQHDLIVASDADVLPPRDFLATLVAPLADPQKGLVTCFYELARPVTTAMRWEAVAINADSWSQVLQARSLKPIDFALGAVMATRRKQLDEIGGFAALANCLADDYQLGNRIARKGYQIVICPVPVACWSEPMSWAAVWNHQLRWARTIRVCQPLPYFFSILGNATLWPILWLALNPSRAALAGCLVGCLVRVGMVSNLQARLTRTPSPPAFWWLAPVKDLLQAGIWATAFMGDRIEWRGQQMRLRADGTLVSVGG